MGLFDSGNGKEVAEAEVMQVLKKHPMLENIIKLLNGDIGNNSWATQCTDYYDNRERTVLIGPDLFCVKMKKADIKADEKTGVVSYASEEYESAWCTYTQFGYKPLHMFTASNGKTVNLDRVVSIWAKVFLALTAMIIIIASFAVKNSERTTLR